MWVFLENVELWALYMFALGGVVGGNAFLALWIYDAVRDFRTRRKGQTHEL